MKKEQWKPVVGFEGSYEISNLGRVKSLERLNSLGRKQRGMIMKQSPDSSGYYQLDLRLNDCRKSKKVHHLVAQAFIGPRPEGLQIDHIDNSRTNNVPENLEYVTQRQNIIRGKSSMLNSNKSSQYLGVTWDRLTKKWRAQITINKKHMHLGLFKTELEASRAYQEKSAFYNILCF